MAPLYSACSQLHQAYSPLSSRKLNHLPGSQTRSVPFVRQARTFSKFQAQVVRAVSEEVVTSDHASMTGNGASSNGAASLDQEERLTPATRAVHGGERAGRPRVSGKLLE